MSQSIACSVKKVLVSGNVVLITVLFWQLSKSVTTANNWRLLGRRQVISLLRLNGFLANRSLVGNSSWDGHALWVPTNVGKKRVWVTQKCCLLKQKTPWPESASELYRPNDRRLSAKLVPTIADRWCRVVSMTDPYARILGFLDRSCYYFF
jgi:hypothetical protein